jgi:hypothetical protein
MSQLKAKQLKLPEAGALLIGGTGGTGTTISATGNSDKILRVVDGKPAWSVNDHLVSENGFNKVVATDNTGLVFSVQNADGNSAVEFLKFKSGVASDESLEFSSVPGAMTIAAKGTEADIDIIIAPQGNGDVILGNEGGGVIQADDGEDLQLLGGNGVGNLILNGGGAGRVYYGADADDATKEVATVGVVDTKVNASKVTQTRSQYVGTDVFTLEEKTIPASIIVHVNGLVVTDEKYAYNVSTNVVTFNPNALGYALESFDQVVFTYEMTA